ncbi:hypothetical protein L7F22_030681 [Adiantum nelumboides]|nr:hypothetical protein [Adiantum nelumboides]
MVMQRVLGMEWGHALLGLLCMVAVCVEMCDAAAVVDVYRMIQYDLQGVPFGSRRAALNHHASSLLLYSNANHSSDLSRSVIIVPIARASFSIFNDLLRSKQVLGGLLLLLPSKFANQGSADDAGDSEEADADVLEKISELEHSLIHSSLPVLAIASDCYEDLFTADSVTVEILEAREQIWLVTS